MIPWPRGNPPAENTVALLAALEAGEVLDHAWLVSGRGFWRLLPSGDRVSGRAVQSLRYHGLIELDKEGEWRFVGGEPE